MKILLVAMIVVLSSFNFGTVFAGSRTNSILDEICLNCPKMQKVFDQTFTAYEMRSIQGFISPRDSKNLLAIRHLITDEKLTNDEVKRIQKWINEDRHADSMKAFDKLITVINVNYRRIFLGEENPKIIYICTEGEQGIFNGFPIGISYFNWLCRYISECNISDIYVKCGDDINETEYHHLLYNHHSLLFLRHKL